MLSATDCYVCLLRCYVWWKACVRSDERYLCLVRAELNTLMMVITATFTCRERRKSCLNVHVLLFLNVYHIAYIALHCVQPFQSLWHRRFIWMDLQRWQICEKTTWCNLPIPPAFPGKCHFAELLRKHVRLYQRDMTDFLMDMQALNDRERISVHLYKCMYSARLKS